MLKVAVLAALIALSVAPAAQARRHARRTRAAATGRKEDDPRLKGDSKAFAKAKVSFSEPADLAVLEPAPEGLRVSFAVQGYALGPAAPAANVPANAANVPAASAVAPGPVQPASAPHAHLIVDNDAALEVDQASAPLLLRGLKPGPHALRLVLCRPWHEVVKAPAAFALVRFWLGPRLEGKSGHAAEFVAWPDPRKPLVTYVLPLGDDAGFSLAIATPPGEPAPTTARPHPARQALDFYLSGAQLRRRGRGFKVRLVIDKKEYPILREWKPFPLKLPPGSHRITIDLLDRRGTKVRNAVNRTDRTFTLR